MNQCVGYAKFYKELRKFTVKIEKGIENWSTLVGIILLIQKNRAERELRENSEEKDNGDINESKKKENNGKYNNLY